ncbi:MAG: UDP-2,3-diacylglucosamine diphosphatase [Smithellaceae bacterium]|nr:UDP-2,3-diacylglucosamine diphosphatase [Smithellaceae bacterium]
MRAIFLADAHLRHRTDDNYRLLMDFLSRLVKDDGSGGAGLIAADALYIAGDFFDFWFGRGQRVHPEFSDAVAMLDRLAEKGVEIHLCEGNHDFFLKEFFAPREIQVHPEGYSFDLDGYRVLISHGDTMDRGNTGYLMLRFLLRSRAFYLLQKAIPLRVLWGIAATSSDVSKGLSPEKGDVIAAKASDCALEMFRQGIDVVLVGHSHRPILREYLIGGERKTFVSLGDWIHHFSYLYYADGKFTLSYYRPAVVTGNHVQPRPV